MSEKKRPLPPRSTRLQEFAEYRRIASIDEMGRRKFANNAFDGILTMVGVVMGSYVGGVREPRIIVSTGLATCMAMGISGFWGAYVTESAERKRELQDLEHAMLRDLGDTEQARASRFAAIVVSVIDGLSPLVAGMFVLLPFLFAGAWFAAGTSYVAALDQRRRLDATTVLVATRWSAGREERDSRLTTVSQSSAMALPAGGGSWPRQTPRSSAFSCMSFGAMPP